MEPLLLQGRNGTKAGEETIQHEGKKRNYAIGKTNLNHKLKTILTLRHFLLKLTMGSKPIHLC